MDPERDDLVQEPVETDTSVDEEAPAPAEPAETQDTPRLYAGKYKTLEEFERAYNEAQQKISELGEKSTRLEALLTNPAPAYPGYPMSAAPGAPVPPPVPTEPEIPVDEAEWFSNPKAAAAKLYSKAKADAVAEAARAAREEAARIAQLSQMEQQFFATYPELKKYPRLVSAAASEVAQKMSVLDPYRRSVLFPDPMKAVAEMVKADLSAIAEEARTKPQTTPPLHVGGGAAPVPTSTKKEPQKPLTEQEFYEQGFEAIQRMHRR